MLCCTIKKTFSWIDLLGQKRREDKSVDIGGSKSSLGG